MRLITDEEQISKQAFNVTAYQNLTKKLKGTDARINELHIFATNALARTVNNQYNLRAVSLDNVRGKLFPSLETPLTDIYLKSVLRKEIQRTGLNEKLLDRLPEFIQTCRVFAEFELTSITPGSDQSDKVEIIQLVNFLLSKEVFTEYRRRLNQLTKEEISSLLCGHTQLETIYVYEIEYLNYFRLKFFHWLSEKGIKIEFTIPYDQRYPRTFSFWDKVYSVVGRQKIRRSQKEETMPLNGDRGSKFVAFNENIPGVYYDAANVEITEFYTPDDFQKYFNMHSDQFLAIESDEVERLVFFDKKGLYDDEFGKFIYFLHQCKRQDDDIELTYHIFTELLTSGWVQTSSATGEKALSLLIELQEYMQGTENFQSIIDRLQLLQDLELVSKSLDRENMKDVHSNHMKRYMLNPFRTFSYIHPDRHDITITQLVDLAHELKRICHYVLLMENESVNVNEYMERWLEVLKKAGDNENKSAWRKVFSHRFPAEWNFGMQELFDIIFLSANQQHGSQNNIPSEGLLLDYILNDQVLKPLHLTNLTFTNFPVSHHTDLSIFFTYTELKEIVKINFPEDAHMQSTLFHSLWIDYEVKKQFETLGVYRIYSLLNGFTGKIIFSWIKDLHTDGIKNVYLDILADLYQGGIISVYQHDEESVVPAESFMTANDEEKSSISRNLKGKIPDLFWLDHDFCSKKFYLTCIVERHPVYHSDFHQQFVFSKIGKLFSQLMHEREEFRELIYPLFPHWTYTKKENLIDMEYKVTLRNYKHFENISYPKEMKSIQILRSVYRENRRTKARNQFRSNNNSNENELIKQFQSNTGMYDVKAEPGNHCKMCPHLASCNEGMYSIESIT
ncbi:hypothetical protein ORD22_01675 [Sporosarcina sp. GW1-11]|uniref:hypothetical protein n=1 Tax=Sporosarcina sp. GW1-11 TaxID=2899126 RepID=UPI00294F02C6|nr:hypothetical protein [Sporosarcina sp. GW1-11]MDV6376972.1 hypothetical protein [Sporosarcina sp. GW1-11]